MGRKRKSDNTEEQIKQKIRKLNQKLKRSRRIIQSSSESASEESDDGGAGSRPCSRSSCSGSPPPRPPQSPSPQPPPDPASSPQREPSLQSPIISQPSTSKAVVPVAAASDLQESTVPLADDILVLLGDAPKPEITLGQAIHKDVASRWQEILAKGLSKDIKTKILEEYLIPSNCDLLVAPLLNPEAKAALPEVQVKRDFSLMLKQKQIGIAVAALSQATELILANETSAQKILKPISDACRLLCDSHFNDTKTRRNFVTSVIDANLKETLSEASRDKYLFGENISDKLKAAKSIQRSGETLKTKKPNPFLNKNSFALNKNNNNRLNSKAPYRKTTTTTTTSRPDAGRARPSTATCSHRQSKNSYSQGSSYSHRGPAERSPPPARRHPHRK